MTDENCTTLKMDEDVFSRTTQCLREVTESKTIPGAVVGLWWRKHPDQFLINAFGQRRLEPSSQPLEFNTPFDVSSLTKIYATTTLVMKCIERGYLTLDARVGAYFPSLTNDLARVTIGQLLTHTSGLPAWIPLYEKIRDAFRPESVFHVEVAKRKELAQQIVLSTPLETAAGTKEIYSDLGPMILGWIVEDVLQEPFEQAVENNVFQGIGATHSFFRKVDVSVDNGRLEEVAATERSQWRGGVLQGQVHDDNTWAMGGVSGASGVFASAEDLLRFVRKLYQQWLSPSTLELIWMPARVSSAKEWTYGWNLATPGGSTGGAFSSFTVGHLGFTGTSLWLDLKEELAVVLLTNRVHPSREQGAIREVRKSFHRAIREDCYHSLGVETPLRSSGV